MHVKIPKCMSEHAPVVVAHEATNSIHTVEMPVRYDHPTVRSPSLAAGDPAECNIRQITYECNM